MERFVDRSDAGWQLAERLEGYRGRDVVVLGLPRGGVPVAYQVAVALDVPLDVIVVRKLGVPFQPEVAMGAVGEDGIRILDPGMIARAGVTEAELAAVEQRELRALEVGVRRYRRGRDRVDLRGRTAIVVDDGLATGATARAACRIARSLGAAQVVLAVPVGPPRGLAEVHEADVVVAVAEPADFRAVGLHYVDFSPTSDDEVVVLLDRAARRTLGDAAVEVPDCDVDVEFDVDGVALQGHLHLPDPAPAIVVFAHGTGSGRHSARNRFVADLLYDAGIGTFLLDLLSPAEEHERRYVFDVDLLAGRLAAAVAFALARPEAVSARVGLCGASSGAAAALVMVADHPGVVAAVVSRGGRPDLASARLAEVTVPTLLVVGGEDTDVLEANRTALDALGGTARLAVVADASHLFEESGTLAEAGILARDWFTRYLLEERVPA